MIVKSVINTVELEKAYKYLLESVTDTMSVGGPPFAQITEELKKFVHSAKFMEPEAIKRQAFNIANGVGEVAAKVGKGVEVRADGPQVPPATAAPIAPTVAASAAVTPVAVAPDAKPQSLSGEAATFISSTIDHLISLRPKHYEREAGLISKLVHSNGPIDVIFRHLLYLVIQIREDLWKERANAFKRIGEALKSLEDTEKVVINSVNSSSLHLSETGNNFNEDMESGLKELGSLASAGQVDLESLCLQITARVAKLQKCVEQKKQADQAHIAALTAEREKAEQRLARTRRDYEDFTRQSHSMLKEIETLKAVSLKDPLTGIYNRRAYDSQIVKTVEAVKSKELRTCCLVVFDIDHFRDFNNTYGHLAGDKVLAYVAKLTCESLRSDDLIFRYGGDEFVIIMPNAIVDDAMRVAEKVRQNVTAVEFKLFKNNDVTVKVTISMGVAEIDKQDDPICFFTRADKALYQAKSSGRNQVSR